MGGKGSGGSYMTPMDVRELARSKTKKAIRVLTGIMCEPNCPPNSRIRAAIALLDRGWGLPSASHHIEVSDQSSLLKVVNEIVHVHETREEFNEKEGLDDDDEAPILELKAIRHNGDGGSNGQGGQQGE